MAERQVTLSGALNRTLHDAIAADDHIVCIGEDIGRIGGPFGVTAGLLERFGSARIIETPISETAFLGMAAGAAMTGLRPIVEIMFCDFIGVCFDQLMNQIAKARYLSGGRLKMPLVIRTTMGAGDGSGAMHSAALHGLMASVEGLTVVCPTTPQDAAGLLHEALKSDGPVVFMEHKGLYDVEQSLGDERPLVPIGRAKIARKGKDLTIVAASAMAHTALVAADALQKNGLSAEVIDLRTIKPLDWDAIVASVAKTGRLLVVDEGAEFAGLADAVISGACERAFAKLKCPPAKICPPDVPVPYATAAEAAYLPSADTITERAAAMVEKGKK